MDTTARSLLSIVVPVYLEEGVIGIFYERLRTILATLEANYDFEIIFVDDGSTDNTAVVLKMMQAQDSRLRVLGLSRNFGHQIAITAGVDASRGLAVIVMDGDLQDPPEVLPLMVKRWEEGFEVVYGQRTTRLSDTLFKRVTARLFYRILRSLSDMEVPLDSGDFRLMDRKVVDVLCSMRETSRYIRGLVTWIGFQQTAIPYERDGRYAGETKYHLRKMVRFAVDGLTGFSERPLALSSYLGFGCTALAAGGFVYVFLKSILSPDTVVWGWPSLILVILFFGGIQLLCIGILGQYLARVYREVRTRPLYIVSETHGFEDDAARRFRTPGRSEVRLHSPLRAIGGSQF